MTFKELKDNAKDALRENYGAKLRLFLIPIILGLGNITNVTHPTANYDTIASADYSSYLSPGLITGFLIGAFIGLILGIIVGIFIDVITVGARFNYIKIYRGEREKPRFTNIFIPFKDRSWSKIFLIHLVSGILLALLSITIIGIPFAIYLALGWSQKDYILYEQLEENKYQGIWGVLNGSASLMKGNRGNYFLFQLSFILWYILKAITFNLAAFWTTPYIEMSQVAYYQQLLDTSSKHEAGLVY